MGNLYSYKNLLQNSIQLDEIFMSILPAPSKAPLKPEGKGDSGTIQGA